MTQVEQARKLSLATGATLFNSIRDFLRMRPANDVGYANSRKG